MSKAAPKSGPKVELKLLNEFVGDVDSRYLHPYISPTMLGPTTKEEELDVAAYAVLTHGALENFCEGLALWVAEKVQSNWLNKRASRSTAAMMLSTKYTVEYETDARTPFIAIKDAIEAAKEEHSKAVHMNNGVALKDLRALLLPLGVDIPNDPILTGSLATLVRMRHQWAHQYRFGAKTAVSAADARKTGNDCLELAKQLADNVDGLKL